MGGYITARGGQCKPNGKPGAFAPGSQYGLRDETEIAQISQPSPFLITTGRTMWSGAEQPAVSQTFRTAVQGDVMVRPVLISKSQGWDI